MKRVWPPLLLVAALSGCGGSDDRPASTAAATTAVAEVPATTAALAPTTAPSVDAAEPPETVAKRFVQATKASDWGTACELYSPDAIRQLTEGARTSGMSDATDCEGILLDVLGSGLEPEAIDVSGPAEVSGDTAMVGEVPLQRVDGRWRVADD